MKYERCITFFLILKTHPFYKKKRRIRIGSSLLQPLDSNNVQKDVCAARQQNLITNI